jgi:hypothetical protein
VLTSISLFSFHLSAIRYRSLCICHQLRRWCRLFVQYAVWSRFNGCRCRCRRCRRCFHSLRRKTYIFRLGGGSYDLNFPRKNSQQRGFLPSPSPLNEKKLHLVKHLIQPGNGETFYGDVLGISCAPNVSHYFLIISSIFLLDFSPVFTCL